MPSGKKSKQARRAAQMQAPPPVQSKGRLRGQAGPLGNRVWIAGGTLVALGVIVAVAIAVFGGSATKPVQVDFAQIPSLQTGPPPWNNGSGDLQDKLSLVHLDPLAQEAFAFHIHMHLDPYVNGQHVTVPALIGIGSSFLTEMHTHTPDGVLHVESAKNRPYVLGQIFGEWGVRLTASCLGRYCGNLHWWVDGKPQTGNPADLIVHAHQEIVIAAGKPPRHIPASYNFPAGE